MNRVYFSDLLTESIIGDRTLASIVADISNFLAKDLEVKQLGEEEWYRIWTELIRIWLILVNHKGMNKALEMAQYAGANTNVLLA